MKNDQKFVRDSNSSLKLLTFPLSNVRELETIKYAFATIGVIVKKIIQRMNIIKVTGVLIVTP